VAYLSDGDLQLTKSARRAEGWLAILNTTEHTKARTESYESQIEIGPRMVAANSSRLRRAVGDSWLAVGDAAASYDPLSSQGIIMSVEMGLRAAETVQRYFLGDYQALEVYARSIDDMFIRYLLNMRFYYSQEARWSSYPFWRRRRFLPQTENLVEANPSLLQSSVKV
jgi:flavin-dependent dehydrogenase